MTDTSRAVSDKRLGEIIAECDDMLMSFKGFRVLRDGPGAVSAFYSSFSFGEIRCLAETARSVKALRGALTTCHCPRPANGRPREETVETCFGAGLCGCDCGAALEVARQ